MVVFLRERPLQGARAELIASASGGRGIELKLRPLNVSECESFSRATGLTGFSGEELRTLSGGLPAKLQAIDGSPPPTSKETPNMESNNEPEFEDVLDQFGPEEIEHLFRAAYLPEISKEGLRIFCTEREATETYNWLRYASKVARVRQRNFLVLPVELRDDLLAQHSRKKRREKPAEKLDESPWLASISTSAVLASSELAACCPCLRDMYSSLK